MTKVKLPLFSMNATGQFGKALSFYGCKSIQTVRKGFVARKNDSDTQLLWQRLFGQAGYAWAVAPYNDDDRRAWKYFDRRLITQLGSWNNFQQEYLYHVKKGETWVYLYDFRWESTVPYQTDIYIKGPAPPPNVRAYLSKGVGYWALSKEMSFTPPDQWHYTVTGLTWGVRESVSFVYGPFNNQFGSTGRFFFTTRSALGPPCSGP